MTKFTYYLETDEEDDWIRLGGLKIVDQVHVLLLLSGEGLDYQMTIIKTIDLVHVPSGNDEEDGIG